MTNKLRAAIVTLSLAALLYALIMLHGQTVAAATENGCEPLGTVGNVIVSRCIDNETGNVVFANSQGFMAVAP